MLEDAKSWARRQGTPVNVAIIGSLIVSSLLFWFTAGRGMDLLLFRGLSRPWTLLTYPWADMPFSGLGLLCFVLLCFWIFSIGGTLERELGSRRYAAFMAAMAILPALALGILGPLFGGVPILTGPTLAVGGMTVAWGTRYPNSPIMLYGVLPIAAKWIACLTVLGTLFGYGLGNPLLGLLACTGYAVAWAYASGRVPGMQFGGGRYTSSAGGWSGRPKARKQNQGRAQAQYDESYLDDVLRREYERDERERLRKLFESSLDDKK